MTHANDTKTETVDVIFRMWPGRGECLALFPGLIADEAKGYITSYEHVGQHGQADYLHCLRVTRPARIDEYHELKQELESIGYKLRVIQRRQS